MCSSPVPLGWYRLFVTLLWWPCRVSSLPPPAVLASFNPAEGRGECRRCFRHRLLWWGGHQRHQGKAVSYTNTHTHTGCVCSPGRMSGTYKEWVSKNIKVSLPSGGRVSSREENKDWFSARSGKLSGYAGAEIMAALAHRANSPTTS